MRTIRLLLLALVTIAMGCADPAPTDAGDPGLGQWVDEDAGQRPQQDVGDGVEDVLDTPPGQDANPEPDTAPERDAPDNQDDVLDGPPDTPPQAGPPGSRCGCDDDCAPHQGSAGRCVTGICMIEASGTCSFRGSPDECPQGGRCWPLRNFDDHPICWPDCDAFDCEGNCDDDGSCAPRSGWDCDVSCGEFCNGDGSDRACAEDNPRGYCEEGELCDDGVCVTLCTPDNPDGFCQAGYTCVGGACIPNEGCGDWQCDLGSACDDIIAFPGPTDPMDPDAFALGYFIDTHLDYAYLRRDLVILTQWATCQMRERFPELPPLGLADLTQSDGRIPGTDVGNTRHPSGTHDGSDLDIAYYQTDGVNDAQIICGDGSDRNGNGTRGTFNDGRFCTTEENIVDIEQQTYFMALLAHHRGWRIVGVDVTLADDIEAEVDRLESLGIITSTVYNRLQSLGYGESGGWAFHHHHIHVSYYD